MNSATPPRPSVARSDASSNDTANSISQAVWNGSSVVTKYSSASANGFFNSPPRDTSDGTADHDEAFDPYTYTPHTSLPPILPRPSSQEPIDANVSILSRSLPDHGMPHYRLRVVSSSPGCSEHDLCVPLTKIHQFVSPLKLEEFENELFRHPELEVRGAAGALAKERDELLERTDEAHKGTVASGRIAIKMTALKEGNGVMQGVKRKRGPGRPPRSILAIAGSSEGSKSDSRSSSAVAGHVSRARAYVEVSVTASSSDVTRQRSEETMVKPQRYAPPAPELLGPEDQAHGALEVREMGIKSSVAGEEDDIEDEDQDELASPVTLQNRYLSASALPAASQIRHATRTSYKTEVSETSEEDEIEDVDDIASPQKLLPETNATRLPIRATSSHAPVVNRTGCPQHPQRRRAGCSVCHPMPKSETWRLQLQKIKAAPSRPAKPPPAERATGAKVKSGAAKSQSGNTQHPKTSSGSVSGSHQVSQSRYRSGSSSTFADSGSPRSRATSHSATRSAARSSAQASSKYNNHGEVMDEDEDEDEEMSEGEYEIESILADKLIHGERLYFVKWLGYDYQQGSWMREDELVDADELVQEYLLRKKEAGVDGVEEDNDEMVEESESGF